MRDMRGSTRRSWAAGVAAVALAAGPTACTGGSDDDGAGGKTGARRASAGPVAEKQACTDGTYTWTGIGETKRLTGVTEPESLGKGGGRLTYRLARVYTPHQSVEGHGPALSSAEVLFSLGKKAGLIESDATTAAEDDSEDAFTDVNRKAPELNENGTDSVDGAGRFVRYAFTTEVAGDFRYSCADGTAVLGHAVGWKADGGGILDCDHSIEGLSGDDVSLARSAARLVCDAGSVATKGA
ncbi:hypothetical protein ACIBVL_36580 [Streptomyces sp. NPDC049687]|uniref:hypothetical protein n=1 Tax=Streptomyces sp. NPDC049687 TaxID=3365596 RepID=UPI0037A94022